MRNDLYHIISGISEDRFDRAENFEEALRIARSVVEREGLQTWNAREQTGWPLAQEVRDEIAEIGLLGPEPAGAGLANQRRRVGGAGHVGGRVADLRVAEQRGIDLPHVSGQAAGPAEVQRVDQDRRVRALGRGDDAGGVGEGPHARVDRELQADVQVVLGRAIAELANTTARTMRAGCAPHGTLAVAKPVSDASIRQSVLDAFSRKRPVSSANVAVISEPRWSISLTYARGSACPN